MKLEFENSRGERRVIANPENVRAMWDAIHDFLEEHHYKAPYYGINLGEVEWQIDVGSHSEFFYLSDLSSTAKDELYQLNKEASKTAKETKEETSNE